MAKCLNLAKLPKSPVYTHVHFYRQNPGSPSNLCQQRISRSGILDPSHPATKTPYKNFPTVQTGYFRLRAFPNALLAPNPDSTGSPTWPKIDSWVDRVTRASGFQKTQHTNDADEMPQSQLLKSNQILEWVAPPVPISHPVGSIPMSLYFSIGKARTHKHAAKRRKLRTKLKGAINLIVTRGAQTKLVAPEVKELVSDYEGVKKGGDKWILSDWAYICYPTPSLYLAPYTELIQVVSVALEKIWKSGMRLEKAWAEAEMRGRLGLPPLPGPVPKSHGKAGLHHTGNRKSTPVDGQPTSNA